MSFSRNPALLDKDKSVLVAVDLQEPFLRGVYNPDGLHANVGLLLRAARILGVPLICTLQYAQRMGGIAKEFAELTQDTSETVDKLSFSCAANSEFVRVLGEKQRNQIVLCGVETHICVLQTALDLVEQGYAVNCAADAVSSRTIERHKLGMERMRDCGVLACSAEGAVFEWLYEAKTEEFKAVHALVRSM